MYSIQLYMKNLSVICSRSEILIKLMPTMKQIKGYLLMATWYNWWIIFGLFGSLVWQQVGLEPLQSICTIVICQGSLC